MNFSEIPENIPEELFLISALKVLAEREEFYRDAFGFEMYWDIFIKLRE